VKVVIPQGQIV